MNKVSIDEVNKLDDEFQRVSNEIDRLAEHLLLNYPGEIGKGDPVNGESAVDVAIRLLSE
jgi:hypothetical protein